MAKEKDQVAEQAAEVEVVEVAEQAAEVEAIANGEDTLEDLPVTSSGKIKVRVVKQVEGRKIGDEFECYPNEVKFQIKHKSIEVIGEDE